jgi:hypothetical protein
MKSNEPRHKCTLLVGLFAFVLSSATGCVTVRPEQRAILADPTMQMKSTNRDEAALQHVLENREGSFGGGAVEGGGCGCN